MAAIGGTKDETPKIGIHYVASIPMACCWSQYNASERLIMKISSSISVDKKSNQQIEKSIPFWDAILENNEILHHSLPRFARISQTHRKNTLSWTNNKFDCERERANSIENPNHLDD
jgi:hypothetical protein